MHEDPKPSSSNDVLTVNHKTITETSSRIVPETNLGFLARDRNAGEDKVPVH
jgi:hypothetical protein